MSNSLLTKITRLEQQIEALTAERDALVKDKERLDALDQHYTMASNSERYLPTRIYWGGGTHRTVRQAIDQWRGLTQEGR